jgi:hypothetical protein
MLKSESSQKEFSKKKSGRYGRLLICFIYLASAACRSSSPPFSSAARLLKPALGFTIRAAGGLVRLVVLFEIAVVLLLGGLGGMPARPDGGTATAASWKVPQPDDPTLQAECGSKGSADIPAECPLKYLPPPPSPEARGGDDDAPRPLLPPPRPTPPPPPLPPSPWSSSPSSLPPAMPRTEQSIACSAAGEGLPSPPCSRQRQKGCVRRVWAPGRKLGSRCKHWVTKSRPSLDKKQQDTCPRAYGRPVPPPCSRPSF